jgi:hypothetical protein
MPERHLMERTWNSCLKYLYGKKEMLDRSKERILDRNYRLDKAAD